MKRFGFNIFDLGKLLVFLTLIIGLLFSMPTQVWAQTEIRVVNPETGNTSFLFYTNTTFKDDRFNLTLRVYNVNDLFAFQVFLLYNSTLLNATNAWLPTNDGEYVFYGKNSVQPPPTFYYEDDQYGTGLIVGDTLLFGETSFVGNGLLAIVEFKIIYEPAEGQSVSAVFDYHEDTLLLDPNLNDISSTKTNGNYQYTWAQPLFLLNTKPSPYEATTLGTFNITIWLNNTVLDQELVNVSFRLNYDATLLNATQVVEGSFLKGVGTTTFNYTLGLGNVTITNSLESPTSFPEGDGEIAIITFESIYQDAEDHLSYLRFKDIQLLNSTMGIIVGSKKDGIYTISFASSQISINVDKQVAIIGSNVTISGSISPAKQDVEVTVQYRRVGALTWRGFPTVRTNVNGDYTLSWTANETGNFEFLASWPGDSSIRGDESEKLSVEVKLKTSSTITINVAPNPVVVGNNVTINGALTPKIAGVNITIEYRLSGETSWTLLDKAKTDSQGLYSLNWTTPELGTFEIRASWPGDANTAAAQSTVVTLNVVESIPFDYLPYIIVAIVLVVVIVIVVLYLKRR